MAQNRVPTSIEQRGGQPGLSSKVCDHDIPSGKRDNEDSFGYLKGEGGWTIMLETITD